MAKLTDRERRRVDGRRRGLDIATDALADVVFSVILSREAELVALTEAGRPAQEELDVVRALLRLILSSNVRMPLSRLQ